jgi:hypothetical protein
MPSKKDNKKKKANPILEDDNEIEETDEQETETDTDVEETDDEEVEEEVVKKPAKGSKTAKVEKPLIEREPVKVRQDNRIEAQLKVDAQAVKDTLSKEPKVRIFVPLGIGEKKGAHAYETVTINGYRMVLMKGEYSTVPQSVANMIESHYNMTPEDTQAGQAFRLDRNRTKDDGMTTDEALLN